jgi:hypothetical protein
MTLSMFGLSFMLCALIKCRALTNLTQGGTWLINESQHFVMLQRLLNWELLSLSRTYSQILSGKELFILVIRSMFRLTDWI